MRRTITIYLQVKNAITGEVKNEEVATCNSERLASVAVKAFNEANEGFAGEYMTAAELIARNQKQIVAQRGE